MGDFGDQECKKICRQVIRDLQAMDFATMPEVKISGDDSVLANTWDEICVQMQSEKFTCWDIYETTIDASLMNLIESLPEYIAQSIWLKTNQGFDWHYDNPDKDEDEAPYSIEDIRDYILNKYILYEAEKYSNKRIRKYLNR